MLQRSERDRRGGVFRHDRVNARVGISSVHNEIPQTQIFMYGRNVLTSIQIQFQRKPFRSFHVLKLWKSFAH